MCDNHCVNEQVEGSGNAVCADDFYQGTDGGWPRSQRASELTVSSPRRRLRDGTCGCVDRHHTLIRPNSPTYSAEHANYRDPRQVCCGNFDRQRVQTCSNLTINEQPPATISMRTLAFSRTNGHKRRRNPRSATLSRRSASVDIRARAAGDADTQVTTRITCQAWNRREWRHYPTAHCVAMHIGVGTSEKVGTERGLPQHIDGSAQH